MLLTDMVWACRYPVYNKGEGADLGAVQWIMDNARGYEAPLFGIPQAYRWGAQADDRFPSPAEYRDLVWPYIIGGARGLVPYSFTDSGLLPDVAPTLWGAMADVNTELSPLLPYLTLGTFFAPSSTDENIKAAFWKLGNACLVAIENHRTFTAEFSIAIPAECAAKVLRGDDATGVTLNATRLSGRQNSLQVRSFFAEL